MILRANANATRVVATLGFIFKSWSLFMLACSACIATPIAAIPSTISSVSSPDKVSSAFDKIPIDTAIEIRVAKFVNDVRLSRPCLSPSIHLKDSSSFLPNIRSFMDSNPIKCSFKSSKFLPRFLIIPIIFQATIAKPPAKTLAGVRRLRNVLKPSITGLKNSPIPLRTLTIPSNIDTALNFFVPSNRFVIASETFSTPFLMVSNLSFELANSSNHFLMLPVISTTLSEASLIEVPIEILSGMKEEIN